MGALRVLLLAALAATASALTAPARMFLRRPASQQHASTKMVQTSSASEDADAERSGRVIISVLAGAGAVETGVLTADKLWPTGALDGLCLPGGGCSDVLSGPWSSVAGVPLASLGFVAYATVATLAALPLLRPSLELEGDEAAPGASALVFGAGALAAFSACLMLLLLLVLHQSCVLCFASAGLSTSILLVAWRTPLLRAETEKLVFAGSGALVSAAAAAALFVAQGGADGVAAAGGAAGAAGPVAAPKIRAHSSARALAIATKLQERGARFYGAYWCSHCRDQKEALGMEAMRLLPYMECDANGVNTRRAECTAVGIKGYPTWELDGALFPGERDLDELEEMIAGKAEPDGVANKR